MGLPVRRQRRLAVIAVCGHRVGSATAQAERVALSVQPISTMEQRAARTDPVTSQSGRWHGEPIRAFQGNQRIPYRDVLRDGDVIMRLPANIHRKAGWLQIFVGDQLLRRTLATVGTTLRQGWACAIAAARLATPHPAQRLNFWWHPPGLVAHASSRSHHRCDILDRRAPCQCQGHSRE